MASELERLRARNAELEKRFDDMQRGNLLNTYLTIDGQHKSFNEQLTIRVILDEHNKISKSMLCTFKKNGKNRRYL